MTRDKRTPRQVLRERLVICCVLGIVLLAGAFGLWPDLNAGRIDLNDNVSHFALIERIVRTV